MNHMNAQTLWLRAETKQNERRAPLIPIHAGILVKNGHQVYVEASSDRVFSNAEYVDHGCTIVEKGSWRSAARNVLVVGLQDLPDEPFPLVHRHLYFSHAYDNPAAASGLLQRFSRGGGFIYDFEYLKDTFGAQLVTGGAGYLAGICAAAACLDLWKQRPVDPPEKYRLPTHFASYNALLKYTRDLISSSFTPPKILIIGHNGKSGRGVAHLLDKLGLIYHKSPKITLNNLDVRRSLHEYQLIFNCIKLAHDTPIFLNEDMIGPHTRIRLIGDVSCEAGLAENPIPIYPAPTSFSEPVYRTSSGIDIMAISNITTLMPMECSEMLSEQIFPYLCYFLMARGQYYKSPFERVVNSFHTASAKVMTL
jgi:saccharopine dehydrogenase (NAD+, L-lysine forming)